MNTDFLKNLDNVPTSRRDALRTAGRLGAKAALASIPFLSTATAEARGVNFSPEEDVDILNYALTLEYLENAFYQQGVAASGLIPAEDLPLFQTIADHEAAHVALLAAAITDAGGEPVVFTNDDFDFTAGGMFDPFGDYQTFLLLSQAFEDTGVRAYKGQAAEIMSPAILTVALQIHSVEARHAAAVRRIRGLQGWIPFDQPGAPDAVQAVYGPGGPFPAEDNVVQGGVDLAAALGGTYSVERITEAFDEALDMDTVRAIANPFIVS